MDAALPPELELRLRRGNVIELGELDPPGMRAVNRFEGGTRPLGALRYVSAALPLNELNCAFGEGMSSSSESSIHLFLLACGAARGGVAIVQDPNEALTDSMPQNALSMVDVDFCLPIRQIADVLVDLNKGRATNITESPNGGSSVEDEASADRPTSEPPGDQIPVACPECNGPIYQVRNGELTLFECFVGHRFAPESLSDQHTEALERALWAAIRKLKERIVLHEHLVERKRNKGEDELRKRLKESITTAEEDIKLLREVLDRI